MRAVASRRLSRALLSAAAVPSSRSLRTLTALPPHSPLAFDRSGAASASPAGQLFLSPWSIIQHRGVKIQGSEVVKAEHNQQGRGSALIQVELRDVESGNKVNARFNTDESIAKVFVEEKSFTCMCTINDEVALIDPATFEQLDVKKDLFGKNAVYLEEEMKVTLRLFDDRPLSGSIPKRVICIVKETPPQVPSFIETGEAILVNTEDDSYISREKRALLDNGLTVKVPSFIETGEAILVNTEDDSYISR
ncbi:hypothetical protein CDL15_Pgr025466 [Punica granatum]|uniref:Elongation factor P n=1 Tax=Punica granatum TaxID=22663 RepID=A0A218W9W4_PUNGR|nr:hypothetical protein CDL15_Pgr025466 [Punica granatum]